MKHFVFHSLLRCRIIILPILTTSLIHFSLNAWENNLLNSLGVKGLRSKQNTGRASIFISPSPLNPVSRHSGGKRERDWVQIRAWLTEHGHVLAQVEVVSSPLPHAAAWHFLAVAVIVELGLSAERVHHAQLTPATPNTKHELLREAWCVTGGVTNIAWQSEQGPHAGYTCNAKHQAWTTAARSVMRDRWRDKYCVTVRARTTRRLHLQRQIPSMNRCEKRDAWQVAWQILRDSPSKDHTQLTRKAWCVTGGVTNIAWRSE